MAVTIERASAGDPPDQRAHASVLASLLLAPLSIAVAAAGAVEGWDGGVGGRLAWVGLTLAWAAAGAVLLLRHGDERLGLLLLWFALLAGIASLAAGIAQDRPDDDTAALMRALTIALLPAAAMHVLFALPSGRLATRGQSLTVGAGYGIAACIGLLLWTDRPASPAWPLMIEVAVAAFVGVSAAASRHRFTRGNERRRMHWVALAIAVAAEVVLVALTLHVLVGWPPHVLQIVAVATILIPLALLLETSKRLQGSVEPLLVHAISLVGLTALVVAVYLVVVVGLGRTPTDEQQTLLVLSIVAAGITAMLYVPARTRLADFAYRLVHGTRQAPNEVVRSFGSRLSRAVPLEELLLQLAESLRNGLALEAAEIWAGSGGLLERVASDPDRGTASLRLTASEESVVARAGVSGPARIVVWLPELLAGRGDAIVRVAPITNGGELFGLIVVERAGDGEPFDVDDDGVLQELVRGVGLAMRNVRLDSELQASLEELRQQAEELRASRARIVAAANAERRRIERDLHDGAQQYLVGLAVQLRLARDVADSDPDKAKRMLAELSDEVHEAQQSLRDLAHGIYPPLLLDRGLAIALSAAAGRTTIPARVEGRGARRYAPDVEATAYFCCLEALQNAAKHAGDGARATVRVWEEEGGLRFEVADDGAGFDVALSRRGAGLTNMQDRLGAIGGSLLVESEPGQGTKVVGTIPLER
jgi:signal transduction histidine kinase